MICAWHTHHRNSLIDQQYIYIYYMVVIYRLSCVCVCSLCVWSCFLFSSAVPNYIYSFPTEKWMKRRYIIPSPTTLSGKHSDIERTKGRSETTERVRREAGTTSVETTKRWSWSWSCEVKALPERRGLLSSFWGRRKALLLSVSVGYIIFFW